MQELIEILLLIKLLTDATGQPPNILNQKHISTSKRTKSLFIAITRNMYLIFVFLSISVL